jgi:hypothetical protein
MNGGKKDERKVRGRNLFIQKLNIQTPHAEGKKKRSSFPMVREAETWE